MVLLAIFIFAFIILRGFNNKTQDKPILSMEEIRFLELFCEPRERNLKWIPISFYEVNQNIDINYAFNKLVEKDFISLASIKYHLQKVSKSSLELIIQNILNQKFSSKANKMMLINTILSSNQKELAWEQMNKRFYLLSDDGKKYLNTIKDKIFKSDNTELKKDLRDSRIGYIASLVASATIDFYKEWQKNKSNPKVEEEKEVAKEEKEDIPSTFKDSINDLIDSTYLFITEREIKNGRIAINKILSDTSLSQKDILSIDQFRDKYKCPVKVFSHFNFVIEIDGARRIINSLTNYKNTNEKIVDLYQSFFRRSPYKLDNIITLSLPEIMFLSSKINPENQNGIKSYSNKFLKRLKRNALEKN